jgi:hypothetical protein
MKKYTWFSMVLLMLMGMVSAEAAPKYMNVQGYLLNSVGSPERGTFNLSFTLTDEEGNSLWRAATNSVSPDSDSGFFSVDVKVDDAFVNSIKPMDRNIKITLEATDSTTPKKVVLDQVVVSVPYALNARQAVRANDLEVSGSLSVTGGTTVVLGKTTVKRVTVSENLEELDELKVDTVEIVKLSGAGETHAVLKANELQFEGDVSVQGDVSIMRFSRYTPGTSITGLYSPYSDALLLVLHPKNAKADSTIRVKKRNDYTGPAFEPYDITPNLPNGGYFIPLKRNQLAELQHLEHFTNYSDIYFIYFDKE